MYPIKFENLYFKRIWGGNGLNGFRNNIPESVIGESWDIACHKNGTGIVSNGKLKGKKFDEIIELKRKKKAMHDAWPLDSDSDLIILLII